MNAAIKIMIFIGFVFLIGLLWSIFNFAIQTYQEAISNISAIDANPYPIVSSTYLALWGFVPLILGLLATALYLINKRDRYEGGQY